MKRKTVKVNMNISETVLAKIDTYAEQIGLNRSATMTLIASTFFNQQESVEKMGKAIELLNATNEG